MRILKFIFSFNFAFAAFAFAGDENFAPSSLLGVDLAALNYYISNDKYQEAIWMLEDRGYFQTAQKYKVLLLEKMQAEVSSRDEIKRGVSVKYKLTLTSKIKGLFKPASGQKVKDARVKTEVATYVMDQILDLRVVPMTIFRQDGSGKLGVFQYWIHDAIPQVKLNDEIRFLDRIIYNQDRHENNRLGVTDISLGGIFKGRVIAIDHNRTFGSDGNFNREHFSSISRHAWEKLNDLQDDGFMHKYFDGLLNRSEFDTLNEHIDLTISYVKQLIEANGEDNVILKDTIGREPRADFREIFQKVPAEMLEN